MFKQRFIRLCNDRGVSPSAACAAIGLSNATFSCWTETSVPRRATLQRIADYFGTSVAYLTGVVDDPDPIALVDPSKKAPPIIEKIDEAMKDLSEEELEDLNKYIDFLRSKRRGGKS